MPAAGTLAADVETPCDLGNGQVLGKERRGLQATLLLAFVAFDDRGVHNQPYYEVRDGTSH
jgi:hypothetical protein